jgi:cytochrome c oxidase subunit 2
MITVPGRWRLPAVVVLGVVLAGVLPAFAQDGTTPAAAGALDAAASTYTYGYWLPPRASAHAKSIDDLINIIHWFMGAIFVGWGAFFVYCLFKFRARSGHKADPAHVKGTTSKVVEIAVAGFEVVLLLGFSIPLWAQTKTEVPAEADSFVVRVVAEQFAWNIHYPGADGVFGRTSPEFVSLATSNFIGLDPGDESGKDDLQMQNMLRVPKGKPVLIKLSSKDVIHSLALPVMRVKQDAIPGMQIPVWFTPTETGVSQIQCAQLCGNNHSIMRGTLVVEENEEAVRNWMLAAKKASTIEFEE